jgi:SH3-like domain-containing protein
MRTRHITLPQSEIELAHLLKDAANVASVQALVSAGIISPYMSLRQCYENYGTGRVNGWVRQGLIHKIKDGEGNAKTRISRVEIEAASRTNNRAEWYIDKYESERLNK